MATRGSMRTGWMRLFSTRSLTTCRALAKAASVASLLPNISRKPDIALRAIVPDLDGAILGRVFELDHRRQRLVVDLHQLGRIARLGERLGDDERDPVADEAHLARH